MIENNTRFYLASGHMEPMRTPHLDFDDVIALLMLLRYVANIYLMRRLLHHYFWWWVRN